MSAGPDTQWPRWEVFKQDGPGKRHQAVGSVHAADPQHALYTARSVFARRPAAVSLWVALAQDIHAITLEQRQAGATLPGTPGPAQPYRVFGKASQRRAMTFVDDLGTVEAASPQAALEQACERYGDDLLVWWVVPEPALHRSPEDAPSLDSWFAPAQDKTYRQQGSYGLVGRHPGERRREQP
ncbi:phenylacetic acid degradation protein [Deinococcus sonorensis]|uniref:Phenylacetic acid degradation protein n=2 Tax=Deinococcus sonorensis TaxID=309891 RepID=A0AAU7UDM4_9DEIO